MFEKDKPDNSNTKIIGKSIKKGSYEIVSKLANALDCSIETLMNDQ